MNPKLILVAAACVTLCLPAHARAQQPSVLPPVQHTHVVSTNLIGIVAKWFNVEYEHKAGDAYSAGLSGSAMMIGVGDGDIRRANAFVRYYPQGSALNGFYIGARGGVLWNWVGDHQSALTAGLEIGHTTLYGANKNVSLSVGFGLDRAWHERGSTVIPNIRLFNVGVAF